MHDYAMKEVALFALPIVTAIGIFWVGWDREPRERGRIAAGGMALISGIVGIWGAIALRDDKMASAVMLIGAAVQVVPWLVLRSAATPKLLVLLALLIAAGTSVCAIGAGVLFGFAGSIAESGAGHNGGPGAFVIMMPAICYAAICAKAGFSALRVLQN